MNKYQMARWTTIIFVATLIALLLSALGCSTPKQTATTTYIHVESQTGAATTLNGISFKLRFDEQEFGFLRTNAVSADRIKIDNSFGYPVVRFDVKAGDASNDASEKSELVGLVDEHGNEIYEKNGSTIYYEISLFLPADWRSPVSPKGGYNHLTFLQFKSPLAPCIAAIILGEEFIIRTNTWSDGIVQKEYSIGEIERGKWINLVFKFSFDEKLGAIEVWRNGQVALNVSGVPTALPDSQYEVHTGAYRSKQDFDEHLWIRSFFRAGGLKK